MRIQAKDQIIIDAPADSVWRVLAHQFDQIGRWSSGVDESSAVVDIPAPEGALVGGRVCLSGSSGSDIFRSSVQEEFTYYDEQAMRFGYQISGEFPWFINRAENNWRVTSLPANRSAVEFRADLDLKLLPGLFLLLLLPVVKKIWGTWTLEELKHYVEHGQPHPRKLKAIHKQKQVA